METSELRAAQEQIERMRALIRAARSRGAALQPLWSSSLLCETLSRLNDAIDRLAEILVKEERS